MNGSSTQPVKVTFDRLVYGGDALARLPDGKAVFVPLALPGESGWIEVVESRKGYARGRLLELVTRSPQRVDARCPHYGDCGGCHYQHLSYADQCDLKRNLVREQLERISQLKDPPVLETLASPCEWDYRSAVQFHVSQNGRLGFQRMNSSRMVEIHTCHLPMPAIQQFWPQLDLDAPPGKERVHIRCNTADELLIGLETEKGQPAPELFLEAPVSVVHLSPNGTSILAGEGGIEIKILDQNFYVSAASFFQVNLPQAERMVQKVLELVPEEGSVLVDLYCGVGLFTAFLARGYRQVIAVESSESACQDFAVNLDQYDQISLYQGTTEEILPALALNGVDTLLADPPRAGLDRRVLDEMIKIRPKRIVYISCDPSSFARDAKYLCENGFALRMVQPVDMFPQTLHIETISLFEGRC